MAEKKEKTEQEYVIPLRGKYQHVARYKKTPKAIKSVKEFIARHMKVYDKDLNKIKLDKYVNEFLWARGIKNPPHKIKVKAKKDSEGIVNVELVELPDKLKFKKAREEKISKEALAKVESKKGLKERMQEQVKGTFKKQGTESPTSSAEESSNEREKAGEKVDENKDGVDDKVEEKEKKESVKEAGEKMEKEMAKKEKHTSKVEDRKKEISGKKANKQGK